MSKLIDLTGLSFGKLIVLRQEDSMGVGRKTRSRWLCLCQCGEKSTVNGSNLRFGITKSCGCLVVESVSKSSFKHGHSKSPTYIAWQSMKWRCSNRKATDYKDYGGRGIKVCDRWKNSFESFLEDMGEKPSKRFSIDRIDNNGDYKPFNCKWSTQIDQQNNRNNNRKITINGETKNLIQWCRHFDVPQSTAWNRLDRGVPLEEVFLR